MNGFDKLLEHFGKGLEEKLDNIVSERFQTTANVDSMVDDMRRAKRGSVDFDFYSDTSDKVVNYEIDRQVEEEGLGDTIKRKAKRFKQKASRKFWWDGHVSPQEMQAKVKASSDEDLTKFRGQLDTAEPNKQNAHMAKLIDRELKSRYGVSPKGNMGEGNEVGAGANTNDRTTTIFREVINPAIADINDLAQQNRMSPNEALNEFGDEIINSYLEQSTVSRGPDVPQKVKNTIAKKFSQTESDEVGAGGRQATMKTKPEGYLKGQKFVGG